MERSEKYRIEINFFLLERVRGISAQLEERISELEDRRREIVNLWKENS